LFKELESIADRGIKRVRKIKTIAVINMKGGVGKTTLAVNLSVALAKYHKRRVLLIDNDPQFNATESLVSAQDYLRFIKDSNKCTILDIYRDRPCQAPSIVSGKLKIEVPNPSLKNSVIRVRNYNKESYVDLLPSTLELMELDSPNLGTEQRLSFFVDEIKDAYDFVFIDCPPTMSLFALSAFIASDGYIIPIKPDHLSSIGISLLERAIDRYSKTTRKRVEQIGIVFSLVKKHETTDEIMDSLRKTNRFCFNAYIKQGINVARAVQELQTLFEFGKTKHLQGSEIESLTAEFLNRLDNLERQP
jgi:chromosome partitioning protein